MHTHAHNPTLRPDALEVVNILENIGVVRVRVHPLLWVIGLLEPVHDPITFL